MLLILEDRFVQTRVDRYQQGVVVLLKNAETEITEVYRGGRPVNKVVSVEWGSDGGLLQLCPESEGMNMWRTRRKGWPVLQLELGTNYGNSGEWQLWLSTEGSYAYGHYLSHFDHLWRRPLVTKRPTFWERILR